MRTSVLALGVLALALTLAPAAVAAAPAAAADCGFDLALALAADQAAVCPAAAPDPIAPPAPPHCCSQLQVDACTAQCRQIRCKGQIGCTAGECTCVCH